MGLNNGPNYGAAGTIAPATFIKQDTSGDNLVSQAGLGDAPVGICSPAQRRAPGLPGSDVDIAYEAGDAVQCWSIGDECPLRLGGTVARGDYVKPMAGGLGITASSGDVVGAIAVQSGTSGMKILVQVLPKGSKAP